MYSTIYTTPVLWVLKWGGDHSTNDAELYKLING